MFATLWQRPPDRGRTSSVRRLSLESLEDRCLLSGDVVLAWNQLALDAIKQTGTNPLLGSRALAIMQVAVYDAVNAIDRSFAPYFARVHASRGASLEAAAARAAHDTLAALFPSQASIFAKALDADLAGIPPGRAGQGTEVGRIVAEQILTWRSGDGFNAVVPYTPGTDPGDWQPTPPMLLPALGSQWPLVTPFAMTSGSQFRSPPPPALTSTEYATAFNEVKDLGRIDSTTRTADQTEIALFWQDGGGTSFPFGHWNLVAQEVSRDQGLDLVDNARLFALLNIATADALIASWDAKFASDFWRPVTAIRFAGSTSINPATVSDPTWTPLLVTPNFPTYTSGHSTVSSAAAGILTSLFGTDYHFSVGSEDKPGVIRSFTSFDAAAEEAGQSRIYGGIHYQFDNQAGLDSGRALAEFVTENFLLPGGGGPPFALPISTGTETEGNAFATITLFTVILTASSTQVVTIHYDTTSELTNASLDDQTWTDTRSLAPSQTIVLQASSTKLDEPDESFFDNLIQAVNALLSDALPTED